MIISRTKQGGRLFRASRGPGWRF